MDLEKLNKDINGIKQFINGLPLEAVNKNSKLVVDFYNLIQNINKDVNSVNESIKDLNLLRNNVIEKINTNRGKINTIVKELQTISKTNK